MKKFVYYEYLDLLNQLSNREGNNEKIEQIYRQFYEELATFCSEEKSVLELYRLVRVLEVEIKTRNTWVQNKVYDTLLWYVQIEKEILDLRIKNPDIVLFRIKTPPELLRWTGSKSALVELLYPLKNSINGGRATMKQIVNCFQYFLQVDLGNYSATLQEINLRKSGQTRFLRELEQNLRFILDDLSN